MSCRFTRRLDAKFDRKKKHLQILRIEDIDAPPRSESYHQRWILPPLMDISIWYVVTPNKKEEASMNKKLIYIGLDVDDTQYHGAAFDRESG